MRIGLHTGRDAHVDWLDDSKFAGDTGDARKFDATIDDDAANACLDCFGQLALGFIVAVQEYILRVKTTRKRASKLAAARGVHIQTLARQKPNHLFVLECL